MHVIIINVHIACMRLNKNNELDFFLNETTQQQILFILCVICFSVSLNSFYNITLSDKKKYPYLIFYFKFGHNS